MKTVFFGPFIGELGWELVSWQGWVRDVSATTFKDYRKIVSSYPGRYPLYPKIDEFWPHPQTVTSGIYSPRGYITDWWRNGVPTGSDNLRKYKFGIFPRFVKRNIPFVGKISDASALVGEMLDSYKQKLPADTLYFVPYSLNTCPKYNMVFGTDVPGSLREDSVIRTFPIDIKHQLFEKIEPSERAKRYVSELIPESKNIIAIFPRARKHRRPALNWNKDKYESLIKMLQLYYKDHLVAIFGDPQGAYFSDKMPEGCLDLINIAPDFRMDVQVAALHRASIAIGGISGAILLSLAAGCPSLTFGVRDMKNKYFQDNFLNTRFVYYPFMHPDPGEIFTLAKAVIDLRIPPLKQQEFDALDYFTPGPRLVKRLNHFFHERVMNFTF